MPCHVRRHLIQALLGTGALACAGPTVLAARAARLPSLGSQFPLPDLPLLEGGTFSAAEGHGKVVVVYWWASWCPFCAEMSPHIEALWRGQRDRGLRVLGVSIDRQAQPALDHRRRKGYTFPSTLHGPQLEPTLPYPGTIPALWVRGRDGRIVMAETGQLFPEDVQQIARFL